MAQIPSKGQHIGIPLAEPEVKEITTIFFSSVVVWVAAEQPLRLSVGRSPRA